MRFCVSCRQPINIINKAEEVKVNYEDIAYIDNYLDKEEIKHYFVLQIPKDANPNWDKLQMYNEKLNGQFILAFENLVTAFIAKERDIKFYWEHPITHFFELNKAVEAGVSQIIPGMPLIFDLEYLKKVNIKLRLLPNYAYNIADTSTGVCGGWIRPEDLKYYEDLTESCEFITNSLDRERATFNIYSQKKEWKEDLSYLIVGLNEPFYAQYLPDNFGKVRIKCGQRCQKNKELCGYCERMRNLTLCLFEADKSIMAEQTENN